MAAVQCSKCTGERKGFRRELDSWRHRLIHCVGFESILEGIYGPMLLKDINLFADCEPEEIDDWSPEASLSRCSFCKLPLEKLNLADRVPTATSPLSCPSDYSSSQAPTISESSQSAHRFLQAVFHKKDVPLDGDSKIPLVAQDLMKKMIHQFAVEYASKCLLRTNINGVTRTSSPSSETSDSPLDLTMSRTPEEVEPEPEPVDGVLDLSKGNSVSSAASSSSCNHRASGRQLSLVTEKREDLDQQGTKVCQRSALDDVLHPLCPAHRSLLHQILKLAHQEKLLLFLNRRHVGHTESHCCHCGLSPQNNLTPLPVPLNECKSHKCSPYCPSAVCDLQSHCSTHGGDSKSCGIHHHPLKHCNSEGYQAPSYSCVQRCRAETCTLLCSKKSLAVGHRNKIESSFASPPLCNPPSKICSSVCYKQRNSQSCSCYPNHIGGIQARNTVERGIGDADCPVLNREQSPSPPPLSPISLDVSKKIDEKPPFLLHHRQGEDADLALKNGFMSTNHVLEDVNAVTENEPHCRNPGNCQVQSASGTSLEDVMSRFSEKLETIKPVDKHPTNIHVSDKEQSPFPSTSQSLQFYPDSHLTEIITTVLHRGKASDYSLTELFNRHENEEPKSPITRLRRRQEVQAAISTSPDDASTRRQSLKIKRELAMLDQSHNRKKAAPAKRARLKEEKVFETISGTPSDPNTVKEICKKETEADEEPAEENSDVKEEIHAVKVEGDLGIIQEEEREAETSPEENMPSLSRSQHTPELQSTHGKQYSITEHEQTQLTVTATAEERCSSPCREDCMPEEALSLQNDDAGKTADGNSNSPVRKAQNSLSDPSSGVRKSTRHIVPPPRFSSYVTEPRKMFFVACFSENIFNVAQNEKVPTSSTLKTFQTDVDSSQPQSGSEACTSSQEDPEELAFDSDQNEQYESSHTESKDQCQVLPQTEAVKEERSQSPPPETRTAATAMNDSSVHGRLRSSPRLHASRIHKDASNVDSTVKTTCVETPLTAQVQYTSPIKLMFVSQVKDKEGVKYSLKSVGSSTGTEEPFDPCVESSWSGTPQKHKTRSNSCASSPGKPVSSPLKSTTSPAGSASSPAESPSSTLNLATSPAKSASSPAKSASSPAKSTSSSPKSGSRRSSDGTPPKRFSGPESQRSPSNLQSVCETTPPKKRPGRPKKLGPQLEQKVKRPIGRPPKQKTSDTAMKASLLNGKCHQASDDKDNVNKNLKITVMYGRSRRNKRVVSEGFDQLQKDFSDSLQAVDLKSDLGILLQHSKNGSANINPVAEELSLSSSAKDPAPQSRSIIKCQKRDESAPLRKPGRPAKVKISGISVTVTTVSPRQRKIQINKDIQQSPEMQLCKKVLLPELKSAKEPRTISRPFPSKKSQAEDGVETKDTHEEELPNESVAVRHSLRVRKPSIHFLHAVATSSFRSYSRSNALIRRSKQLLLTKANNERRLEEQQNSLKTSGEKRQLSGRGREAISQDLSRVEGVSVDSIFTPRGTLRWWASSAEEQTVHQEFARRIQVISNTWVSDTADNLDKEIALSSKLDGKGSRPYTRKFKHSSMVQTLFGCQPDQPSSCGMQQICSWFMQTTETQSLAIVKKASSRNPYELMHFPRSVNKKTACPSPQAERLRKHTKKFAQTVPKSPLQHQLAQRKLRRKKPQKIWWRLLVPSFSRCTGRVLWWRSSSSGRFQATLVRVRKRFLHLKGRNRRRRMQRDRQVAARSSKGPVLAELQLNRKALHASEKHPPSDRLKISSATCCDDQAQEAVHKERKLCSKAWSPESLKECRVFLRKINSPDSESAGEECTVTLDDGSPSACLFAGKEREPVGNVQTVKSERKRTLNKRAASTELAGSTSKSDQKKDTAPAGRQRSKYKSPAVVSPEVPQPPPAKRLRQSRMRGLTGPRWCDFVFES
ncbi:uncharacterized protein lcorl isoform X1 [Cololabis saira]|uniref:uncharacterized protein lcorl isoform X1 n=1 Tax=Cololabis saira TaxID=129043 RepID=UPI002AD2E10A|nr:uncharacterized protein lcorl isoform X1 [Cololabis saira]